ncbi:MAG: class I SAM-dependent methyltransferase [Succinivibrio sp.]|nr:class I SAM-dependent methyltransferase [Succinivibrio sp.]
MNLSIESQFNLIAREYDGNRRNFIPCFDDFYQNSTDFICKSISPPKNILDLGASTRLLSLFWYRHFPLADFYLVDLAEEMLNVARDRFAGISTVHFAVMNYLERFPKSSFDTVISALSIHHLEHADKQRLFDRIHEILPKGGLFVNYDQFCAGAEILNSWFDRYWINGLQSKLHPLMCSTLNFQ